MNRSRPWPTVRRAAALTGPSPLPPWPPGGVALTTLLCLLLLLALRAPTTAVAATPGRPAADRPHWPVRQDAGDGRSGPPTIERGYVPPPTPWGAGHRGVDLAARAGQPVRAVAPGRVAFAGRVAGRGVVSLALSGPRRGRGELRATYEPVRALVAEGERVTAGQVVGVVEAGPYHCARPCLHWGLLRGGRYVNPLTVFSWVPHGEPPRLLPVFGVPLPGRGPAARQHARSGQPPPRAAATTGQRTPQTALTTLSLAVGAAWARRRLTRAAPRGARTVARQDAAVDGAVRRWGGAAGRLATVRHTRRTPGRRPRCAALPHRALATAGGPACRRPRPARGPANQRPTSASFARSWRTDLVWIWLTLLSVTPSTCPISARVRPS